MKNVSDVKYNSCQHILYTFLCIGKHLVLNYIHISIYGRCIMKYP